MRFVLLLALAMILSSCTFFNKIFNKNHKLRGLAKSDQMVFVSVPAGELKIGSSQNSIDSPKHKVKNSKTFEIATFEIATTEVTQLQWFKYMGKNNSWFKTESHCPKSYRKIGKVSLCSDHPVENVTFNEVKEYLKKYNEDMQDEFEYRLPTEVEWEFAARAGTSSIYSFGDDPADLKNYAWFQDNAYSGPQAVRKKKPNPFGLYDVHGNVSEWVGDNYKEYTSDSVTDPTGATPEKVVIRGGSWYDKAHHLHSSSRIARKSEEGGRLGGGGIGFRPVRVLK